MELALMIEGQQGLTWKRWQRLARAAEDLGFVGLYRSDHFTDPRPPDRDALELWISLAWLASNTQRIEFGPLVSPVSFRHPVISAKMAAAVDDLSNGRLQLGLGAGWQEREHTHYGFELLDIPQRLARFQEGLEVVTRLLKSDEPVTFSGTYYRLQDAPLLPRPQRAGGPPIVIGGGRSVLSFAARYAARAQCAPRRTVGATGTTSERCAALTYDHRHLRAQRAGGRAESPVKRKDRRGPARRWHTRRNRSRAGAAVAGTVRRGHTAHDAAMAQPGRYRGSRSHGTERTAKRIGNHSRCCLLDKFILSRDARLPMS